CTRNRPHRLTLRSHRRRAYSAAGISGLRSRRPFRAGGESHNGQIPLRSDGDGLPCKSWDASDTSSIVSAAPWRFAARAWCALWLWRSLQIVAADGHAARRDRDAIDAVPRPQHLFQRVSNLSRPLQRKHGVLAVFLLPAQDFVNLDGRFAVALADLGKSRQFPVVM